MLNIFVVSSKFLIYKIWSTFFKVGSSSRYFEASTWPEVDANFRIHNARSSSIFHRRYYKIWGLLQPNFTWCFGHWNDCGGCFHDYTSAESLFTNRQSIKFWRTCYEYRTLVLADERSPRQCPTKHITWCTTVIAVQQVHFRPFLVENANKIEVSSKVSSYEYGFKAET